MRNRLPLVSFVVAVFALFAAAWSIYQPLAANSETAAARSDAKEVADPLAQLCATDPSVAERVGQAKCQKAAEVQQSPAPAAEIPGPSGVGIASVKTGDCSLRITLTDGRVSTLTNLCGPPGAAAPPARGIASTAEQGCFVQVAYTDATSDRLGPFCGPAGSAGESPPCMSEPSQCRGTAGESPACLSEPTQCRGAQGVGVAEQRFVRVDGACFSRVTYSDPATGQTRSDDTPAGDNACPDVASPDPGPPTPTEGG